MTTTPDQRTAPEAAAEPTPADEPVAAPADPAHPPDLPHVPAPAHAPDAAKPSDPSQQWDPEHPPDPEQPPDPVRQPDLAQAAGSQQSPDPVQPPDPEHPPAPDPPADPDQPEQMSPPQRSSPPQPQPPSQPPHPAAESAPRPARDAPRWVRWTVLPLLVLVPIGYVAISAEQSRDSGQSKQQEAAARHLTREAPTSLQQRIYKVAIPAGAARPGYLETNSWDTSVLYAQFTTSAGGLDTFLAKIGTSRAALRDGWSGISPAQAGKAGWNFAVPRPYAGIALHQVGDKPDHDIAVDLTNPDAPTVYVVSTVNFQHGFGSG